MEQSLKERVELFWKEFCMQEQTLRGLMDDGEAAQEMIALTEKLLKLAFTEPYFEMGISRDGMYELILTPEGDRARLMELYYWWQQAPECLSDRWNFYYAKPAMRCSENFGLQMYDISLEKLDVWIAPSISEGEKINIAVYVPKLFALEEAQRWSMFFIFLDQFIGERYTMEYIGSIDFLQEKPAGVCFTMDQLKGYIDGVIQERQWKVYQNPCEIYSGYEMKPNEKEGWDLREDIIFGFTSCMEIIHEYYAGRHDVFDRAYADGAVFGYIFFDNREIPREKVVSYRGEIEERLAERIREERVGEHLGGASGFYYSYMDFFLFDLDRFLEIAAEILIEYSLKDCAFSEFVRTEEVFPFEIDQLLH